MSADSKIWAQHLYSDEQLLWAGRPKTSFFTGELAKDLSKAWICLTTLTIPILGLRVVAALTGQSSAEKGALMEQTLGILFAIIIIGTCLYLLVIREVRLRQGLRFAITNRRALRLVDGTSPNLGWTPLDHDTDLRLANIGTLAFARDGWRAAVVMHPLQPLPVADRLVEGLQNLLIFGPLVDAAPLLPIARRAQAAE